MPLDPDFKKDWNHRQLRPAGVHLLTSKTVVLGAARSGLYDVYSTHSAQIGSFFYRFAPLDDYFKSDELEDFYLVALKYLRNPKAKRSPPLFPVTWTPACNMTARTSTAHGFKTAAAWDDLIHVSETLTCVGHHGLVFPAKAARRRR